MYLYLTHFFKTYSIVSVSNENKSLLAVIMTSVFALYRIAPCYVKGKQNVYFDASNTEETSIAQKVYLMYMYTKSILLVVFSGYKMCIL